MNFSDWNDISQHDYSDRLHETQCRANGRAFQYIASQAFGAGRAWQNVRRKNERRYLPRGYVVDRLERLESSARDSRMCRYFNLG